MSHESASLGHTPAGHLTEAELQGILGYQVAQASVTTARIYERLAVADKLHRLEYSILMLVLANPGCTAASLAKALDVSTPNMALWLERLTDKHLIERTPSASDRRANQVRVTTRGEQVARRLTKAIRAAEAEVLWALTAGERAILAELLHKVARCRQSASTAR